MGRLASKHATIAEASLPKMRDSKVHLASAIRWRLYKRMVKERPCASSFSRRAKVSTTGAALARLRAL